MTPEEFTRRMRALQQEHEGDEEACHSAADRLLCEALMTLGYEEGLLIYEAMDKWYA